MMRRRLAVAVALAVGLTGCLWEAPGNGSHRNAFNQTERLINAASVARLEQVWSVPTDVGAARFPIVSGEAVHVVDDTHLYGIDKATGVVLWRFDAPNGTTIGPAFDLGDPGLLVGAGPWGGGTAPPYATHHVDPTTGAGTDPNRADGWVVGMGPHNYLFERLHRGGDDPALPLELHYEHVDTQRASRSWAGRILVGRDATQATSPSIGYQIYQAGAGPLVDASGQFSGSGNALRGYSIVEAPTGPCSNGRLPIACPAWSTRLEGATATSPVLADRGEQVFTGTDTGELYAIDGAPVGDDVPTGTILWQASVGEAVTESPARAYGVLYVPTADGDLVAVDEASGALLWTAPTGSSIDVQPAVGGGLVFTASADGTLHAFDVDGCGGPATCPALWSVDTGDAAITGAPAISEGRLFVGTADGRLVAFALPA